MDESIPCEGSDARHDREDAPHAFVLDGDALYWTVGESELPPYETTNGAIMRLDLDGGLPAVLMELHGAHGLAFDGTNMYWSQTCALDDSCQGIFKMPRPH